MSFEILGSRLLAASIESLVVLVALSGPPATGPPVAGVPGGVFSVLGQAANSNKARTALNRVMAGVVSTRRVSGLRGPVLALARARGEAHPQGS